MVDTLWLAFLGGASSVLCGLAYRLRGSVLWSRWTGRGVGTARLFVWGGACGIVTALHAVLVPMPWWLPFAVWLGAFAGSTLPQWKSIDIGRMEGNAFVDTVVQSARGALSLGLVSLAFWFAGFNPWITVVAGAVAGPVYAAMWAVRPTTGNPELNEPAEFGELLSGAIVGSALSATLLLQWPGIAPF